MFEPHYQPDPRISGIGLGFFRGEVGGHRTVGHDGICRLQLGALARADDGVGVMAFTNGSTGAVSWLQIELDSLLRQLLGISEKPRAATFRITPRSGPTSAGGMSSNRGSVTCVVG